jgi:hypothetical protein
MQKACIAIIFALALSCAVAADPSPVANGWAKTPVAVCEDSNLNCTNRSTLTLGSLTTSDVNIISYDRAVNDSSNFSSCNWNVWTKVIDTKVLTSTSNTSYTFKAPQRATLQYGLAGSFDVVNDTSNVPQLVYYQTKLGGTAEIPRIQLTSNKDANYTPIALGGTYNTKYLFFVYAATISKVNFTSVAAGASTIGKEFTLTTTFNASKDGKVQTAWGEALSSSQVYAGWKEGDVYKVAALDFSSGTLIGSANLGNYNVNYTCSPYATDKKYYGVWCQDNTDVNTTSVYVSANSTSLLKMFTIANKTIQKITESFPYSGYFGFFYTNGLVSNATTLSHEIWDVEKFVVFKNKTDYLTYDTGVSTQQRYRVPQGGIFSIYWNTPNVSDKNSTKTKVLAGLVLEGSYLTTIFGSLMALIAGLLLF